MKLLIVGATGGLGKALVGQALEQGHEVTALVRNPAAATFEDRRLRVRQGDVLDARSLGAAVAGQEAVVSALGSPNPRRPTTLLSEGTRKVVTAMEEHGVRRFICVTILGTGNSKRHGTFFYRTFILGFLVKPMLEDKERQEQVIRRSNLEWVIVRPPRFTDEPARSDYRVILDGPGVVGTIARADLAAFMLAQLKDDQFVYKAPIVGY